MPGCFFSSAASHHWKPTQLERAARSATDQCLRWCVPWNPSWYPSTCLSVFDEHLVRLYSSVSCLVNKGNLQNLQVTDEVLMGLMDYPLDAFEIYIDPQTGAESIRIKSAYRTKKNKVKGKTSKKKTKSNVVGRRCTDSLDWTLILLCSDHYLGRDLGRWFHEGDR